MDQLNIIQLAPLLAYQCPGVTPEPGSWDKYQQFIAQHASRLGNFYNHLGKLHDFIIFSSASENNVFCIKMQSMEDHEYVTLEFKPASITYYTIEEDGILTPISPVNLTTYLYEEVIGINEDTIKLGILATNREGYVFLQIKAALIDVISYNS